MKINQLVPLDDSNSPEVDSPATEIEDDNKKGYSWGTPKKSKKSKGKKKSKMK